MAIIIKDIIARATTLGVWKKEEPLDLLESVFELNETEQWQYNKISNVNRKKEWLTTRILLTELLGSRFEIEYSEYGKPSLKGSKKELTISHSKNFVSAIISNSYKAGVDIETISERVLNVKTKFLTPAELDWCSELEQCIASWSAKESVFKIYEKELDFHDIVLKEFNLDEEIGRFGASVVKNGFEGFFIVNYIKVESDILTYSLLK